MLCIIPERNGHYLNYIEILEQYSNTVVEVHLSKLSVGDERKNIFKRSVFIYELMLRINNNPGDIIFLHGDKDIIYALLSKIFFRRKNIKAIIYYSYFNIISTKSKIKKIFIYLASKLGVEVFLLEAGEDLKENKNIKNIYDPCLLESKLSFRGFEGGDSLRYLIAGYLDDRKCVKEIVVVLNELSNKDGKDRVLVLLGVQSKDVKIFLDGFSGCNNFKIEIVNERFSDDLLHEYIFKSKIVLCLYKNHYGSSGMLLNALLYEKLVLFIPVGVLGDIAGKIGFSTEVSTLDIFDISNAIIAVEELARSGRVNYVPERSFEFLRSRTKKYFFNTLIK